MPSLRRLAYLALGLGYAQIVFGAVVRITGSGMGCGEHWPKCLGRWFPPLDRPDLIIEYAHRLIALALLLASVTLVLAAWRRRAEPSVSGPGGVLRAAGLAVALWFVPALLGAVAVWLALPPIIVVAHLAVAMTLLAVLAVAAMRAGGLGAARVQAEGGAPRTARGALAAAALALVVVLLGGLTANVPGAAPACQGFPLCNGSVVPRGGLQHLHFTHRVLAYLLVLHVVGLGFAVGRRGEPRALVRAARVAMGVVILQLLVGAALVETFLPPLLQSTHQAVGTLVWLTLFVLAALARRAARGSPAPLSATHARDRAPAVAARGVAS